MKLTKTIFTILTFFISITVAYSDNYENLLLDKIEILIHSEKFDSASFLMDSFKKRITVKSINSNRLRYYNQRILLNRYINRPDEVKIYTDSVVSLLPEITPVDGYDSLIVAFGYSNVGNAMFEKNKFNESIEYFEDAIRFSSTPAGKNSQAIFYQNVGLNYLHLGQTEKGVENVNKAFGIYERIDDIEGKFGCLDYLGNTMVDYRNFELARKFFNMALEIKDSIKNEYQNSSLYNNIGRMFNYQANYDSALYYFNLALKEAEAKKNMFLIAIAKTNIGEINIKQEKYEFATEQVNEANRIFKAIGFPMGEFQTNHLLAYCKFKQNDFNQSEKYQNYAEVILKETQVYPSLLIDFYKRSYEMEKSFGKTNEALQYLEAFQLLEDSIKNHLINWKINEIESRLLMSVKERELAEKNLIIQKHKYNTLVIAAASFIIVIGFLFFIWILKRRKEKQIREQQERILHLKLENTRKLISPHFTFNVLNNILSVIDNSELVKKQFKHLMVLIRSTLVNSEKLVIPLGEEISLVESYTGLQSQLMNDFEINWNIKPGIDLTMLVPCMILQLPVENALKHGLWPKSENRRLWIDIFSDEVFLNLVVTDNGVGLQSSNQTTKGTGTGLQVLSKTIHILNRMNNCKISYDMHNNLSSDGGSGVQFSIKIPLSFNFKLQ